MAAFRRIVMEGGAARAGRGGAPVPAIPAARRRGPSAWRPVLAAAADKGKPRNRSETRHNLSARGAAGGRVCTVRASKGAPEAAACGMLGEGPAANPRGGAPLLKPPPRLRDAFGEAVERARASMQPAAAAVAGAQQHQASPSAVK